MISGGNATVYVRDMESAVQFYTGVLGLRLKARYGDSWAEVEAGGFTIGLHPPSPRYATEPGVAGSVQVGLLLDVPIDDARKKLLEAGSPFVSEIIGGTGGSFVNFQDLDGNQLYLWEQPK